MSHEWIELIDPKKDKPFYANIKTGSCTWDKPLGSSFDINSDNNVEWWELYDKKHDMPYYYNTRTKFTDWIRPKGVEIISLIKLQQETYLKNVSRNSIVKCDITNESYNENEYRPAKIKYIGNNENQRRSVFIENPMLKSIDNVSQDSINDTPEEEEHSQVQPLKIEHHRRLSTDVVNRIKFYGFDEYAKNNFMEHREGIFRKKIPIENLLSWSNQSLRKPLLKSSRNHHKDALYCFSLIQRILGNKKNDNLTDVQKLVEIGINNAGIRDEIYCQICKQLNKNPNFDHIVSGWKLMSVLVIAFPPSRDFENYLKCFIEKYTHSNWTNHLNDNDIISNTNNTGKTQHLSYLLYNNSTEKLSFSNTLSTLKEEEEKSYLNTEGITEEETSCINSSRSIKEIDRNYTISRGIKEEEDKNYINIESIKEEGLEVDEEKIKTIQILSKHCYRKLVRTCIVGPRGKTLSLKEIEQCMNAAFNFSCFGETLEDIMEQQKKEHPELKVPAILLFLADAILQLNGTHTEGIFRIPGDADAVSELKCQIEKGIFEIGEHIDPNIPASLLKHWLRELAEPVIPTYIYEKCVETGKKEHSKDIGIEAWEIINSLPEINKNVITYMIRFLKVIAKPENIKHTKMTIENLAMVFAPNFLRCPNENPHIIFENSKYEQAFIRILISN